MFDEYVCDKIMRYASGDVQDLKRVKKQMTMEAILQGTEEHIMHHVMINFMLNGEMRFMQFDFTRESADTKNVFLFVEDYTDPQQQMMLLQKKPFCETVHPDDQQYVEESVRSLNIEHPHTNIFYRKRNPQGKWFYMQPAQWQPLMLLK